MENANYNEISDKLTKLLSLTLSPVAIKLYTSLDDIDSKFKQTEEVKRHCELVKDSAEGKTFYATLENINCANGIKYLGLIDKDAHAISSDEEVNPNKPIKLDPSIKAISYEPLADCTEDPDIVIMYVKPIDAMKVAKLYESKTGNLFNAKFAGMYALCSELVSRPYLLGESNMSLGCPGSRGFSKIKPEEMVVGLTMDDTRLIMS